MNNPYPYSADNKRYLTYNHYLKERFGAKVYRIALDCGAGCPNRDGVRGSGGCVFCAEGAAARGKFCGMESAALRAQFERGRLIAPQWSLKKLCVMNEIDKEMVKRGSWQGKFYQK